MKIGTETKIFESEIPTVLMESRMIGGRETIESGFMGYTFHVSIRTQRNSLNVSAVAFRRDPR